MPAVASMRICGNRSQCPLGNGPESRHVAVVMTTEREDNDGDTCKEECFQYHWVEIRPRAIDLDWKENGLRKIDAPQAKAAAINKMSSGLLMHISGGKHSTVPERAGRTVMRYLFTSVCV